MFVMLMAYPLAWLTALLGTLSVVLFFVTSSDSASLVADIIASGGGENPTTGTRLFWGILEGTLAAVLLLAGGLSALQTGSITLGSGTTPTLLGDEYVAIADNAEPRVNVLVYRRGMELSGGRKVCEIPVFEPRESATENTLIGVGSSLIVENNYGYDLFTNMMFGRAGAGGVTRIDVNQDGSGCTRVWHNPISSQTTVPKLSREHGLVYVYSKDPSIGWGVDAYYLAALDFHTGEPVYEVLTGTGVSYDNNWAPITLGVDACAYVGVVRGLVSVCDGAGTTGSVSGVRFGEGGVR
jgi:hypothetical protein